VCQDLGSKQRHACIQADGMCKLLKLCFLSCPQGWEGFTDATMAALSARRRNLVFLLWGKAAQAKVAALDTTQHHVLTAAHPSPYSARKVGNSQCNMSLLDASRIVCVLTATRPCRGTLGANTSPRQTSCCSN
jgi:hypothetical protein